MNTKTKSYIFRWRNNGICVIPSRSNSPDHVWEWVFHNLRRAGEEVTPEVKQRLRELGEVIPDED